MSMAETAMYVINCTIIGGMTLAGIWGFWETFFRE